jgi:hypothetical protein
MSGSVIYHTLLTHNHLLPGNAPSMLAALAYTWVLNTLCPQYSIIHFISYILRDVPGVLSLVSSFLQAIYTSFCMPLIYLLSYKVALTYIKLWAHMRWIGEHVTVPIYQRQSFSRGNWQYTISMLLVRYFSVYSTWRLRLFPHRAIRLSIERMSLLRQPRKSGLYEG